MYGVCLAHRPDEERTHEVAVQGLTHPKRLLVLETIYRPVYKPHSDTSLMILSRGWWGGGGSHLRLGFPILLECKHLDRKGYHIPIIASVNRKGLAHGVHTIVC